MAYDRGLAQQVRELLEEKPGFSEKKMFGGICFLLYGNMACGILNDDLIVRIGPEGYAGALEKPHIREFDFTGRSMKGWVMVSPDGYEAEQDLDNWVSRGSEFSLSLPRK